VTIVAFLAETYSLWTYAEPGIEVDFVQDNHSLSAVVGTVRGLYFKLYPHSQAKLVRCGCGVIFDLAIDIRRGSQTHGTWASFTLNAENGAQKFYSWRFSHSFATL
jgi:dTDP-4-dehydrorhamnose 3,5-epimerase